MQKVNISSHVFIFTYVDSNYINKREEVIDDMNSGGDNIV